MELQMHPMKGTEHFYCYAQSQQLSMQTGLIGHLRADMDTNGTGFFSSWFSFRDSLKSDSFKQEFDEVLNELREEGNILHNRATLSRLCIKAPESAFNNGRNEFGFRVDTEHYSYMMRLNPNKGEYNLYCYCYVRQWLERHMKQAERGIRFITPSYEEKFRIADGDSIRIVRHDGEKNDRVCRYIDETHFEFGMLSAGLFHICQFAEKCENGDIKEVIPLRASLPEKCCSYLESTGEIILITKGERGYVPQGILDQNRPPREVVDEINATIGVNRAQEAAMVIGSMFGWGVPGADPKNYNEKGVPIHPGRQDRGDAR